MSAYIAGLQASVARDQARRDEEAQAAQQAARELLTPLEDRLARPRRPSPSRCSARASPCPHCGFCLAVGKAGTATAASLARLCADSGLNGGGPGARGAAEASIPSGIAPDEFASRQPPRGERHALRKRIILETAVDA